MHELFENINTKIHSLPSLHRRRKRNKKRKGYSDGKYVLGSVTVLYSYPFIIFETTENNKEEILFNFSPSF